MGVNRQRRESDRSPPSIGVFKRLEIKGDVVRNKTIFFSWV